MLFVVSHGIYPIYIQNMNLNLTFLIFLIVAPLQKLVSAPRGTINRQYDIYVLYILVCAFITHKLYVGLASLRMDLSEEPTLGQWKIIVNVDNNRKEQTFTVDEYGWYQAKLNRIVHDNTFVMNITTNNSVTVI